MTVTGFISLSPGLPTQCLNQLSYLATPRFRVLEYHYNAIVLVVAWDLNEAIDIRGWSICEGGQLDCIETHTHGPGEDCMGL